MYASESVKYTQPQNYIVIHSKLKPTITYYEY